MLLWHKIARPSSFGNVYAIAKWADEVGKDYFTAHGCNSKDIFSQMK